MYIVSAYYLALILAHALAFFLLCPGVLFTIAAGTKVKTALAHALVFGLIALVAHTLMFKAFFYNHKCSCACKCGKCDKKELKETLCVRTPYMFGSRGN